MAHLIAIQATNLTGEEMFTVPDVESLIDSEKMIKLYVYHREKAWRGTEPSETAGEVRDCYNTPTALLLCMINRDIL